MFGYRDSDSDPAATVGLCLCSFVIAVLVACTVFLSSGCVGLGAPAEDFTIKPGVTTIEDVRRAGVRDQVTEAPDAQGTTVLWYLDPRPGLGRGGLAVLRFCQNGRLERIVSFVKN